MTGCPLCARTRHEAAHALAEMRRAMAKLEAKIAEQRRQLARLLAKEAA